MPSALGGGLLSAFSVPTKRKVFVSYHHRGDQWYYDEFSRIFHEQWEAVYDNSLERQINSDNTSYVIQRIRENHITGTSCTIVLIGAETHQRKYVDWEIKATLDKKHGLMGVVLPSYSVNTSGQIIVPDRFLENVSSGYARWINWGDLNVQSLKQMVENSVSANSSLICNGLPMKQRNG